MIRLAGPPLGWRNPRRELPLAPGDRLVVVSPHLDDAALSLGATLAQAAGAGVEVVNLTVFAGDPSSSEPAGDWDRKAGFSSAGEAAGARRAEDAGACAVLRAKPVWLPFKDGEYEGDRSGAWASMEPVLRGADLVLVPGFPLRHPDHQWVSRVVQEHSDGLPRLGRYVEQPYAELAWVDRRQLPGPEAGSWARSSPAPKAWFLKHRALRRYDSQLKAFASPPVRFLARTAVYELARGGEYLALDN